MVHKRARILTIVNAGTYLSPLIGPLICDRGWLYTLANDYRDNSFRSCAQLHRSDLPRLLLFRRRHRPMTPHIGRNAKTAPHARHRHPATTLGKFPSGTCFVRVSKSRLIEISNVRLIHSPGRPYLLLLPPSVLPPPPLIPFATIACVVRTKCACNIKKVRSSIVRTDLKPATDGLKSRSTRG